MPILTQPYHWIEIHFSTDCCIEVYYKWLHINHQETAPADYAHERINIYRRYKQLSVDWLYGRNSQTCLRGIVWIFRKRLF